MHTTPRFLQPAPHPSLGTLRPSTPPYLQLPIRGFPPSAPRESLYARVAAAGSLLRQLARLRPHPIAWLRNQYRLARRGAELERQARRFQSRLSRDLG